MADSKNSTENLFKNIQDFSSVLKDLSLNFDNPKLGRKEGNNAKSLSSRGEISPRCSISSSRSSLGILSPETLANASLAEDDTSVNFKFNLVGDLGSNKPALEDQENLPPTKFMKPRFEIESGILDEDGETDLENFLDEKEIQALDEIYSPSSATDTETESSCPTRSDEDRPSAQLVSSGEELAKPLERTTEMRKDEDLFLKPRPPTNMPTPRALLRPRPDISTPKGLPSSLLQPNKSLPCLEESPCVPPRAPVLWGTQFDLLTDNSTNTSFAQQQKSLNCSNQQSFNGSGFPWEQLIPKQKDVDESCINEPLDPSFCSGKISARSTSLGPTGTVGNCTLDENFSDFTKPSSFHSQCSEIQNGDESVFHSGFPPSKALYNPFDLTDNTAQTQETDFEEFQHGGKDLNVFFDDEEKECLEKHKFLAEDAMEDQHNSSVFSGISDKSIILRNNGLWTGDTSGVNLEKLREETRLTRCQYFRHNSSRLGSLDESIPESERPGFGFVHKIRSPEHRPHPLLEESLTTGSDQSNRLTYNITSSGQTTPAASGQTTPAASGQTTPAASGAQNTATLLDAMDPSNTDGAKTPDEAPGSSQSSAESTYVHSGDSTKTVVSLDNSGTLKAEDLVNRLETLSEQLVGNVHNVSYPDVVEDSMSQDRNMEKSLQVLMDGDINLSTISRALSDASLSADPQHFVNVIRNSIKAKLEAKEHGVKTNASSRTQSEPVKDGTDAPSSVGNRSCVDQDQYSTTPKSGNSQTIDSVRRSLTDSKTSRFRKNPSMTSTGTKKPGSDRFHPMVPISRNNSISEPPTPRDTPTPPPLTKASSVPFNLNTSRRRRPSGTRHSSPVKKSPKKQVTTDATPPCGLENLLQEAEITPSLCVTSRKHLHTSTPFHPNLNLSNVILDNLTRCKSVSPFVHPDQSINPVDLDVSTVSPELFTSIQQGPSVPVAPLNKVRRVSPLGPNQSNELQININPRLCLQEDVWIEQTFCSHVWNTLEVPLLHAAADTVQTVLKTCKVWIGSLEIPEEFWTNVLVLNSEIMLTVEAGIRSVSVSFFAKREGAFALNLGLLTPEGSTTSGVVRFKVEEPTLRVLTRNGHTIDFGTIPSFSKPSIPLMLVNGGCSALPIHLDIISDNSLFSFVEGRAEKSTDFDIPSRKREAGTDEGVAKEVRIWADASKTKTQGEPTVYTAVLRVLLGSSSSDVELGRIDVLLRVCQISVGSTPSEVPVFTCVSGEKKSHNVLITAKCPFPLEAEVSVPEVPDGIFIFEKRVKLFSGADRPFRIEFVSKVGGGRSKNTVQMTFRLEKEGPELFKLPLTYCVIDKAETLMFSENSPGLKLGVISAAEENLDKFPVESDRSLVNWFAVEPGRTEEQQISLRNSSKSVINLNLIIRETEYFKISTPSGMEVSTKLSFNPKETKVLNLIFSPKAKGKFVGKLVLKPVNFKIGGKIIKATIGLSGTSGCSDLHILNVKSTDESCFTKLVEKEPPCSTQFSVVNSGTSAGFVKIVCAEEIGKENPHVIISPECFLIKEQESRTINLNFSDQFESSSATAVVFFGPEIVRRVYRRARGLPGAARLSSSPSLMGVDFTANMANEDDFSDDCDYKGDLTPEDVKHFFAKTEKHILKIRFPEKSANFDELQVEETLSETRLDATVHPHSPPTSDSTGLQIIPSSLTICQSSENIVKIINVGKSVVHWDLHWDSARLNCSPPAGQLAPAGQAIILVSSVGDDSGQSWRGVVELFSDHAVDKIPVHVKPNQAPPPMIAVNPQLMDFGEVTVGLPEKRVLTISNLSVDLVQWRAVLTNPSGFLLGQPAGVINPRQSVALPVIFRPSKIGETSTLVDFTCQVVKGGREFSTLVPVQHGLAGSVKLQGRGGVHQPTDAESASIKMTECVPNNKLTNGTSETSQTRPPSGGTDQPTDLPVNPAVESREAEVNQMKAATNNAKKSKGTLSLEKENLVFETIPVGKTQVLKVTIKNRTPETQNVNLSLEPGSPFLIIHQQLEVKSQSFSRVPVQFKPLQAGRYGAHLRITTDSGWNLVAILSGGAIH